MGFPKPLLINTRNFTVSVLRRGLLELTINPQMDPADSEKPDIGLGLAGYDRVADPELPLPGARR